MKNTPAPSPVSRRLFWLASAMFFLSGGTGLAYQVIWFKRFSHVWGSSSLAFAAVGGSFLFGLGLGAYLLGHVADGIKRPLAWYGACELAIGLVALVIPYAIQGLIHLSAGFYAHLPAEPLVRFLVQFAVTLLVIGPPCVLMGGTLPLLTRELTARDGALDQATGWLYAINTYGAAAGCYLTGFQLLPALGLVLTNNLAAGLNIAIGLAALWVGRSASGRGAVPMGAANASSAGGARGSSTESRPEHGSSLFALYLAVALSGLAALVLEMTWSRQLALVLGASTYSYSATLFVVLLGIASGSLLFHLRARGAATNHHLLMAVILGLAVTCFAGKLFLPWLSTFAGDHRLIRRSLVGNAGLCVLVAAIVEFLPAVAMGVLFPLFVDLTHERAARVGRAIGNVYAWNTFGSIAGAALTAVVLFPWIGTSGAMGLAMALYLVALLLAVARRTARDWTSAVGCALALAVIVFGISLPLDPLRTNMGQYMYGSHEGIMDVMRCLYQVDGPSSSVAVVTFGDSQSLRINGKADAGDNFDMTSQLGLAYLPRLFRPAARDVMVIGFGSGTSSGSALLFPDTRVTTCEIEPAVIGAESYFEGSNHRPLEKTRDYLEKQNDILPENRRRSPEQIDALATFRVVLGDGRGQLHGDEHQYDLIISEPSNPWIAGVSNLFTQEFFSDAKARLKPGGVLAQWIQTYNITMVDYLMIARTMRTVFPHCGVVMLAAGADTLLLASDEPLLPDAAQLDELQKIVDATPEISFDWQKWFNTTDVRTLLLARYTIDQEMLDQMIAKESSQRINTDLNLLLEFHAPLHLFQELPDALSARLRLARLPHERWTARLGEQIGLPADSPTFQVAQALEQLDREQLDAAASTLQQAIMADPDLSQAYRSLANIYLKQNKPEEAVRVLEDWMQKQPDRFDSRMALFNIFRSLGRNTDAVAVFQPVVEHEPDNYYFHLLLGRELLALRRNAEATRELRRALALQPELADAPYNRDWVSAYARILATGGSDERDGAEALRWAQHLTRNIDYDQWSLIDTLAAAYAEVGRFDEAIAQMQKVLERAQADGDLNGGEVARRRLELYKTGQPLREQGEPAGFKP